jgi:hypothetical protein
MVIATDSHTLAIPNECDAKWTYIPETEVKDLAAESQQITYGAE